ncbi:hypothetical protein AAMO2058_001471200 [Amorphochlora amoebiformis]
MSAELYPPLPVASVESVQASQWGPADRPRPPAQPPLPTGPPPVKNTCAKMIWQVAMENGLSVRIQPSLSSKKVTDSRGREIVLANGQLIDSDYIHKSYFKQKDGKYLVTYWVKHNFGWTCAKYGHQTTLVPLSSGWKIYEVQEKNGVTVRTEPGLDGKKTSQVLPQGQIFLGNSVVERRDKKRGDSVWIHHPFGWSCCTWKKTNFITEIFYRRAFQVILKDGVSIRGKPSLKAKTIGALKYQQVALVSQYKATVEKRSKTKKNAIWIQHETGWSCLKLGSFITMIPLKENQAWWEVSANFLTVRTHAGETATKTKSLLKKKETVVSHRLLSLPMENNMWMKITGGYSCFMYKGEPTMRLKLGAELWVVSNKAGSYIRAKPGAAKYILGFMPNGTLFVSRGMVSIAAEGKVPETTWVRHGRGWTCVLVGRRSPCRRINTGNKKAQAPKRKFESRRDLFKTGAPPVVEVTLDEDDVVDEEDRISISKFDQKMLVATAEPTDSYEAKEKERQKNRPLMRRAASEKELLAAPPSYSAIQLATAPAFDEAPEPEASAPNAFAVLPEYNDFVEEDSNVLVDIPSSKSLAAPTAPEVFTVVGTELDGEYAGDIVEVTAVVQ